jgi:hypothetical protein
LKVPTTKRGRFYVVEDDTEVTPGEASPQLLQIQKVLEAERKPMGDALRVARMRQRVLSEGAGAGGGIMGCVDDGSVGGGARGSGAVSSAAMGGIGAGGAGGGSGAMQRVSGSAMFDNDSDTHSITSGSDMGGGIVDDGAATRDDASVAHRDVAHPWRLAGQQQQQQQQQHSLRGSDSASSGVGAGLSSAGKQALEAKVENLRGDVQTMRKDLGEVRDAQKAMATQLSQILHLVEAIGKSKR